MESFYACQHHVNDSTHNYDCSSKCWSVPTTASPKIQSNLDYPDPFGHSLDAGIPGK